MNIEKTKNKHRRSGFTLAETLVAILIMLMVSSIVAMGIPVARNAYEKVVDASNAEVLLSTTIIALRNELAPASELKVSNDTKTITYYNNTLAAYSKISLKGNLALTDTSDNCPDGVIVYQRYAGTELNLNHNSDVIRLISKEASTEKLYATYDSVDYEDGIITFTNLRVNGINPTRNNITRRPTFSIRVTSYN